MEGARCFSGWLPRFKYREAGSCLLRGKVKPPMFEVSWAMAACRWGEEISRKGPWSTCVFAWAGGREPLGPELGEALGYLYPPTCHREGRSAK